MGLGRTVTTPSRFFDPNAFGLQNALSPFSRKDTLGVIGIAPTDEESRDALCLPDKRRMLDAFVRQTEWPLMSTDWRKKPNPRYWRLRNARNCGARFALDRDAGANAFGGDRRSAESLMSLGETTGPGSPQGLGGEYRRRSFRLERLVDNLLRIAALESGRLLNKLVLLEDLIGSVYRDWSRFSSIIRLCWLTLICRRSSWTRCSWSRCFSICLRMGRSIRLLEQEPVREGIFTGRYCGCDRGARQRTGFAAGRPGAPFRTLSARGSASRQRATDFGLAICKAIVKAHGGVITANSDASVGAFAATTLS